MIHYDDQRPEDEVVNLNTAGQLNDLDPMPFGRYKGMNMQDVPVEYLHWFYTKTKPYSPDGQKVIDYIRRNIAALKQENDDLIWEPKIR